MQQFATFRGKDVADALAQVRATFGENAIVGSTRVVSNGRSGVFASRTVEVRAARGEPQSGTRMSGLPASLSQSPSSRTTSFGPAGESALSEEIRTLRALVEEMAQSRKPKDRALTVLERVGIEGDIASDIVKSIPRSSRMSSEALRGALRDRISDLVHVTENPLETEGLKLISCVGPAGVGKTTTIAKLAARAFYEYGRGVAIVTLDTFRVGAVEQMRRFAQLIGVTFEVAHDVESFQRFLASCREDIVLVDTPSRAPSDTVALRRLTECLNSITSRESHVYLTVPASLRARDLDRIVATYRDVRPTGLVVTKLDETDVTGGAVCASLRARLPFAFLCDGPRVPEDVHEASAQQVLDRVFGNEE